MDEKARERATAYTESIGCYLDLRAKGQRNPDNKFMTGATVDNYVMGRLRDPKSKSPGLAANTLAMCELVYTTSRHKSNTASAPASAPARQQQAAAQSQQRSCGSRRRRAAPSTGF
eukprot:2106370-Pleurochrysis_carterae.AAC.3